MARSHAAQGDVRDTNNRSLARSRAGGTSTGSCSWASRPSAMRRRRSCSPSWEVSAMT